VCRKWKTRGDRLRAKLADLDGLQAGLDKGGDTYLIALEASGRSTKAIVALGNPDGADHVAVTVPGMGAQVIFAQSVGGMMHEALLLRGEVQTQLKQVGRRAETMAAVAWIWYDTPASSLPATLRGRAVRAAPLLVTYLRSLGTTSTKSRAHVTLVGHSYGSLVAGLALHRGANAFVDDYVVYGSAGFFARSTSDIGMPEGHVFVMLAPDDWIRIPARLGLFGGNPADGSFVHLSTAATTTPDGVRREGAYGHAWYPRSFEVDGTSFLRTSGYNTAVVVAGLPELAVPR
jgi:hypothetical protein